MDLNRRPLRPETQDPKTSRLTRARARVLEKALAPRHTRPMSGRPLRRARTAADANGQPVLSRLPRAGISPVAWRGLSPVEKLQALYGPSLDAALEDLAYRGDEPYRIAARTAARHDVMMIAAKHAIELSRERERDRALQALVKDLPPRFRPKRPG